MNDLDDLPEHDFIGDMRDVADTLGINIAQHMVDVLPGIEIKIPLRWSKDSALSMLNRKIADIVIACYPGDVIYVSTGRNSENRRPNAIRLRGEGKTNREIAIQLKVSERQIRHLLNTEPRLKKPDPRQIELFAAPKNQ